MERNEKTALKTSKNEFGKKYTVFQIFLNALNGNKNLNSELFLPKRQNNIQVSSEKELNITKLFSVSKKEKKWILFCMSIINLGYIFLWGTFADEYQIINNNNAISIYHLFFYIFFDCFSIFFLTFSLRM